MTIQLWRKRYSTISDALVQPEERPRRGVYAPLVHYYPLIVGAFISWIVLLSVAPFNLALAALLVSGYWLYFLLKRVFRKRENVFGLPYWSKKAQFSRTVLLILAVTVWVAWLYLSDSYLQSNGRFDTLWLLYLPAIFIMGQYGITELMIICLGLACVCVFGLEWIARSDEALWWYVATIKCSWLVFLSFVLHVLIRALGDRSASLRLVYNVQQSIMQTDKLADERDLMQKVVDEIAANFKYPHVNIFRIQTNSQLKCVASSSPEGKSLQEIGFELALDQQGITSAAARSSNLYCSNKVEKDKNYLWHERFPNTRAELAVPVKIDGKNVAILDIQENRPNAFLAEDLEVMEVMGWQIATALTNLRHAQYHQQLAKLVQAIAYRSMAQYELTSILEDIAQVAYEELSADIVTLYTRDPVTEKLGLGACKGDLYEPRYFDGTVKRTYETVEAIVKDPAQSYFHEFVDKAEQMFASEKRLDRLPFVEREGVKSRVILQLGADKSCVGVLFLNFRSAQVFPEQERETFFVFAHLATLAIQKAHYQKQQLQSEREEMAWHLHDQIMANAFAVSQIISSIQKQNSLKPASREKLNIAQDAIGELMQHVRYLHLTWKDAPADDLRAEMESIVRKAEISFDLDFYFHWSGPMISVSPVMTQEFRRIFSEVIVNAVRYSEASEIIIMAILDESELTLSMRDNGRGFNVSTTQQSGLSNVRKRVERMNGTFAIESARGVGTAVSICAPL